VRRDAVTTLVWALAVVAKRSLPASNDAVISADGAMPEHAIQILIARNLKHSRARAPPAVYDDSAQWSAHRSLIAAQRSACSAAPDTGRGLVKRRVPRPTSSSVEDPRSRHYPHVYLPVHPAQDPVRRRCSSDQGTPRSPDWSVFRVVPDAFHLWNAILFSGALRDATRG
jgi:hypothetical protein